jgi:Na+/H+ antiporter NhaA
LPGPPDRTAWTPGFTAPIRDFLRRESGGAVVLLGATLVALAWANSPWPDSYESVWNTPLLIRLAGSEISLELREWIDQGLMTFFFLVVGLEARRELDLGALRERRRLTIVLIAAAGGMAVAVLIYLAVNAGGAGAPGWAVAMSTDTAFALGVLALLASDATRPRVRLLSAVVFDDVVALVVIATVYTRHVDVVALALAVALFSALAALRYLPIGARFPVAAVLGAGLWVALFESGIDPVVAGLVVGLVTSAYTPARTGLERATELTRSFREQPTAALARSAGLGLTSAISANERLQHRLHPWTSLAIVPLFALANAGIRIDGGLLSDAATSPVTLGIVVGYVVGKPLGVTAGAWLASRRIQRALSWPAIMELGMVAGIGFTVSLLISNVAFEGRQLQEAKVGILAAAMLAALSSWAISRVIARLPAAVRARQLVGTADDLLDISEDVDPGRDHIRGPDAAPVTLVEYGDYECRYCGQAELVVREFGASFGDDLRYVWRHLPLTDVHPQARLAAEAAEAAAAQGAFWAMHDRLVAGQDALTEGDLVRHAQELGLDVRRFADDLRAGRYSGRVAEDVATFFVNGGRHHGAFDIEALSAAVRVARARARVTHSPEVVRQQTRLRRARRAPSCATPGRGVWP